MLAERSGAKHVQQLVLYITKKYTLIYPKYTLSYILYKAFLSLGTLNLMEWCGRIKVEKFHLKSRNLSQITPIFCLSRRFFFSAGISSLPAVGSSLNARTRARVMVSLCPICILGRGELV